MCPSLSLTCSICSSLCIATVPTCYAKFFRGEITLPNSDLLPSLLYKINENQLALETAIMELCNWVEQRGSGDVADNVRGTLETIDKNEEFIKLTLAFLISPEWTLAGRNRPNLIL